MSDVFSPSRLIGRKDFLGILAAYWSDYACAK